MPLRSRLPHRTHVQLSRNDPRHDMRKLVPVRQQKNKNYRDLLAQMSQHPDAKRARFRIGQLALDRTEGKLKFGQRRLAEQHERPTPPLPIERYQHQIQAMLQRHHPRDRAQIASQLNAQMRQIWETERAENPNPKGTLEFFDTAFKSVQGQPDAIARLAQGFQAYNQMREEQG